MRTPERFQRPRAALLVCTVLLGVGVGLVATSSFAGAAAKTDPVTRTVLGETAPGNAPGQDLTLQQVTVQPGAKLPTHFHEGTQVASISSGVLTYTIESGSATVTRAGGKPQAVAAPATIKLRAGDGLVETASLVHHAANQGTKPVVIVLTALLRAGAPLATPVGDGAAGTTPMHLQTVLQSQARTLVQAGASSSITYGTNRLTGTATLDGQPVAIEMLANVDYVSGSGTFFGFVTFTFSDGSTLGTRVQGLATASTDGSSTTFTSTLGVIGGTGRYATTTGSGTFVGERGTALGGDVDTTFDLQLTTKAS
jgi:mannose-6-phosphate isomerase-like protein (cupin superfamily)